MTKIYYAESNQAEIYNNAADAKKILSSERFERYKRLKQNDDKLDCLAVGLMTKLIFGSSEVMFKDKNGCPRLNNGKYISISHSGGICAAALSDNPVGLDIQAHSKKDYTALGRIVLCKSELEYLKNAENKEEVFYKLWCLKESYMKAKGLGFSLSPKSFYFDIAGKDIILHSDDDKQWNFFCFDIENLTAALCCNNNSEYISEKIILTSYEK